MMIAAGISFLVIVLIAGIVLALLFLPKKADVEDIVQPSPPPPPPPPTIHFTQDGNRCARGFELTMKNKRDLYNFSEMGFTLETSLLVEQCESLCAQI